MASVTSPPRSGSGVIALPNAVRDWPTNKLADEAVRAIQTCRKHGQAAAQSAWQAGAYLSLLHARLIKGRRWAAWLRQQRDLITEDTARRYILLYERTGGQATKLDGMTLTEAYAAFGITRYTEIAPAATGTNGTGPIHGPGRIEADHRCQPALTRGRTGITEPTAILLLHRVPLPRNQPTPSRASTRRRSCGRRRRSGSGGSPSSCGRPRSGGGRRPRLPSRRRKGSPVLHGDCLDLIPTLEDGSVGLVVTITALRRAAQGPLRGHPRGGLPGVHGAVDGGSLAQAHADGSVLIVIRPHLRDGVLSDYVLRTRLALREAGWRECEELIWVKPNAPPLGSKLRPRRAWESDPLVQQVAQPYCDLKACGKESDRSGVRGIAPVR